jgi:hypothetical protein
MVAGVSDFVSLPTALLLTPEGSECSAHGSRDSHKMKSLLRYHYQFGSHVDDLH